MYEVYLTLFLSLLTKVNSTSTILPLVLITQENGDLTNPQCITSYKTDDDGYPIGKTTFKINPEDNNKQDFYCGADDRNSGNSVMRYLIDTDKFCLFRTPFFSSRLLRCTNEPEPYIGLSVEIKESGLHGRVYCGPPGRGGEMHAYQYKVCTPHSVFTRSKDQPLKDRVEVEVYKFCYSRKEKQVLYTQHTIKSPTLLNDERLAMEREHTFPLEIKGYQCYGNNFVAVENAYNKLRSTNIRKSTLENVINTSHTDVIAQKIVPHEDLAFALWRKTTYHVLNLKPMRKDPAKVWEYASKLIRDDAISKNIEYEIFTRAFMVIPEIIENPTILQVADIWIKIIRHKFPAPTTTLGVTYDAESFAIILNNNLDRQTMNEAFQRICPENLCAHAFIAQFPELGDTVRCCYAKQIMSYFFNLKFESDAHFIIHPFNDKKML